MSFDMAFRRTVFSEGGYANDAGDPGGETMWGITVAVARAHGYIGPMRDMPLADAKTIYKAGYWDLIRLSDVDRLSPDIAAEMFDAAVNCGVHIPVPFLQRSLNAFNRQGKDYTDIPVDGLAGPRTVDALRRYLLARPDDGGKIMVLALRVLRGNRYFDIVERRAASEDFFYGWLRRLAA
jgi:lysozyme family protein